MKIALKIFFALLLVAALFGFCYDQYQSWQKEQDRIEADLAPQGKLPDSVEPLSYRLNLRIDPDENLFSGKIFIDVAIKEPVDNIWLHGKSINASSAKLRTSDGDLLTLNYHEMGRSGVVRLLALEAIKKQNATIEIEFEAPFDSKLAGLYKIEDDSLNYAFTQFEAISARQAFPCFDEPKFKVPFDISLEIQRSHRGFTNTPLIKESEVDEDFKRLSFATTKPLPTYLIAFAVGDFDVVDYMPIPSNGIRNRDIPLRGIATKGKGEKLTYALENTAAILTTLESYFGSPYPYAKLDIVAVPDFSSGAMENAGLITYRENLLLFDGNPSISQQRSYAYVHAHELAHQWFGNLVTMPWWDDIWLNESFATWMGAKAVHQWDKGFEFDREIIKHGHAVMSLDIFTDSRQIQEPVIGNEEIANAFDGISYSKGGAVLQMLESVLTPEVFQKGIQEHMRRFEFANATADDLIRSLSDVSSNNGLPAISASFLTQPGVPLLQLEWECEEAIVRIGLKQSRYLTVGSTLPAEQQWELPVCLTMVGELERESQRLCRTMSSAETKFEIQSACPLAIMPNSDGQGYYRWSVNRQKWKGILSSLKLLNSAEKYSVASNLAAEFSAGRIDLNYYLESIKPIIKQPEWDLITQPIGQLEYIADYIAMPEEKIKLASYTYSLYKPVLDELGYEATTRADRESPVATQLLRERILGLMALSLKQPDHLNRLAQLGKLVIGYGGDQQLHLDEVDPNLLFLALASAVQVEGEPYFELLVDSLKSSSDAVFRSKALWALGSTTDPQLSEKVLSLRFVLSLNLNEMPSLIISHMNRMENQPAIYNWLKRYYAILAFVLPEQYLARAPLIAAEFCSEEYYQDAKQFFSTKADDVPGMKRILSQSLEKIRLCSALVSHQSMSIELTD